MNGEPSLILGIIGSILAGALALIDGGGLADGLQLYEVGAIFGPILTGLALRFKVFSQATVDLLAPRSKQRQAVAERKG